MRFMQRIFCIVYLFLTLCILFEIAHAKGGSSRSRSRSSSSYSDGGGSESCSNSWIDICWDGIEWFGLAVGIFCVCFCLSAYRKSLCRCFCNSLEQLFYPEEAAQRKDKKKRRKRRKRRKEKKKVSKYSPSILYSKQSPAQVPAPHFWGKVRMVMDPGASLAVRRSVSFYKSGKYVKFARGKYIDRCIQSNVRISGYYEVTIIDMENRTSLALGFATKQYPSFLLPGCCWESHSIAYHNNSGHRFFNDTADGLSYGPRYGVGDVIGCGYTKSSGGMVFFFTRNSKHLGSAFITSDLVGDEFAAIGADGGCRLLINFGDDVGTPFLCQGIHFIKKPNDNTFPVDQSNLNVHIAPSN